MSHHPHLRIIAFTGPAGSGKTTAVEFFTERGIPKVRGPEENSPLTADIIIPEIEHLVQAGQHAVVVDELASNDDYAELHKAFPGNITVVHLVRHFELNTKTTHHDIVIRNDGSIENFERQLIDLSDDLKLVN